VNGQNAPLRFAASSEASSFVSLWCLRARAEPRAWTTRVRLLHACSLGGALALAMTGCAPASTPRFDVVIRVESDPGVGLAGARLSAVGQLLGATDHEGLLATTLRGAAGESVELSVACPAGHRSPADPLSVRLRPLVAREQRPEYRVRCSPLTRRLVLAIRANGGHDMPVRVLGSEIARTNGDGLAHALLEVAPGETLTVALDSSLAPHAALMPRDPELKIVMPEHDEVVLFEQTFTQPAPPRRARKRPEPVGPQPI
jgi:hypothetical protein